jgi:hypothetical protein
MRTRDVCATRSTLLILLFVLIIIFIFIFIFQSSPS